MAKPFREPDAVMDADDPDPANPFEVNHPPGGIIVVGMESKSPGDVAVVAAGGIAFRRISLGKEANRALRSWPAKRQIREADRYRITLLGGAEGYDAGAVPGGRHPPRPSFVRRSDQRISGAPQFAASLHPVCNLSISADARASALMHFLYTGYRWARKS
jgi:hypothetical protein